MNFQNADDRNLGFYTKDTFFSQKQSVLVALEHISTLLVESIDQGLIDQFLNMIGYLGQCFQDLCGILNYRITLELSRD